MGGHPSAHRGGILPVTSAKSTRRMAALAGGARLLAALLKRFEGANRYGEPAVGFDYSIEPPGRHGPVT